MSTLLLVALWLGAGIGAYLGALVTHGDPGVLPWFAFGAAAFYVGVGIIQETIKEVSKK